MCGGADNTKRTPPGFAMAAGEPEKLNKAVVSQPSSALLEFAAVDDLAAFRKAVEEDGLNAHEPALWYGRLLGSRKMGLEPRTPLMIAALYGSVEVMRFLLGLEGMDSNRTSGSDHATALHCAAAGGASSAREAVGLLLQAGANLNCVDAGGNRPGDLIARSIGGAGGAKVKSLAAMIEDVGENSELSLPNSPEKKEYPVDLTLPDIKNGIYSTDEFRMYTFKVKPCSRAYSHDWTECPFVHPGENARRRDPRKYHYSCVPCPEFRKGACRQGDACEYAHGVFECWLHPAQYRTRLCKDETNCMRRVCFFAHKTEELRPLYASTGSAMPSPRSLAAGLSAMDMAAISPLTLGGSSMLMPPSSTPPMSPSSGSPMSSAAAWANHSLIPPALQLPGSRLKTALNARDMEMNMDLLGLESIQQQQQQLIDEIAHLSLQSGRSNTVANALAAAAGNRSGKFNRVGSITPSNLDEMFGSLDSSSVSQLQNLSLKASGAQFQSPSMNHSYAANLPSSPARTPSPFALDRSLTAAAVMNSRSAAFAKRSQSFIDRSGANHYNNNLASTAIPTSPKTGSMMLSDWGSPSGKLDWGIQGEELQKLKKSASFGIRNTNSGSFAAGADVPDVSWVQSLVKDVPPSSQGCHGVDQINSGGVASEMFAPWGEQVYMEQEQMVA